MRNQQHKFSEKKDKIQKELINLDKKILNMKLDNEYERVLISAQKQKKYETNEQSEFVQRQLQWLCQKELKIQQKQEQEALEEVEGCSFTPNIHRTNFK